MVYQSAASHKKVLSFSDNPEYYSGRGRFGTQDQIRNVFIFAGLKHNVDWNLPTNSIFSGDHSAADFGQLDRLMQHGDGVGSEQHEAIQAGDLHAPKGLLGYERDGTGNRRRKSHGLMKLKPERSVGERAVELMCQTLRNVSERDREILNRFYVLGHTQEQICTEMRITPTQVRVAKDRARTHFGELRNRQLTPR